MNLCNYDINTQYTHTSRKELTSAILNYKAVSSLIISLRITSLPMNLTIIQMYASTSDYKYEVIEEFYEEM